MRRQCTYCIIVSTLQFATLMLWLTTLTGLTCFFCFYFEIDNLPSRTFFFFHPRENSYLLFHPRFSLILFILLFFKLRAILFGVKAARYFYYGKCYLAVWVMPNFIIGVRANLSGNHKTIGVTRGTQGARPLPLIKTNDKNDTKPIVSSVSVSFSIFLVQLSRVQQQLAIILILTTKGHGSLN